MNAVEANLIVPSVLSLVPPVSDEERALVLRAASARCGGSDLAEVVQMLDLGVAS